jgi:hypothetical protein
VPTSRASWWAEAHLRCTAKRCASPLRQSLRKVRGANERIPLFLPIFCPIGARSTTPSPQSFFLSCQRVVHLVVTTDSQCRLGILRVSLLRNVALREVCATTLSTVPNPSHPSWLCFALSPPFAASLERSRVLWQSQHVINLQKCAPYITVLARSSPHVYCSAAVGLLPLASHPWRRHYHTCPAAPRSCAHNLHPSLSPSPVQGR